MKFPRCIRLDASDLNIYARAAEPGEWAVPGGFAHTDCDPDGLCLLDMSGELAEMPGADEAP